MSKIAKQIVSVGVIALLLFILLVAVTRAQNEQSNEIVASGGTFTLQKTVVAGGGLEKQTQPIGEHGTAGQAVAGHSSLGGQYRLRSGFWTPDDFMPTAANVVIGGRVATVQGRGIVNVVVVLMAQNGSVRTTATSTLGYYKFNDVPAGESYIVSVMTKRYEFPESSRMIQATDDVTDCNFVAVPIS